jgi:hypothetical protein
MFRVYLSSLHLSCNSMHISLGIDIYNYAIVIVESQVSLVGIVTGYWLDDLGGEGCQECSLLHLVQANSEARLPSTPVGTRGCSLGESGLGVKLTTHLQLILKSRNTGLYIYSLIRFRGVMLNYLFLFNSEC